MKEPMTPAPAPAGSPEARLRHLVATWRERAQEADRLVTRFDAEGDKAGNAFAFLKERRIWTTCADALEKYILEPPTGSDHP